MTSTSELREKKTYTVRNEDTSARMLVIEHPARAEYKLVENGQKSINAEIEKSLRGIVLHRAVVANLDRQIKSQKSAMDQIFADQGRLRENMKALRGSAEEKALLQRYTKQLDDEETQIEALRKNMKGTEGQWDKANGE
jgi:peptidoglycan hydrolase CwlO-like protein